LALFAKPCFAKPCFAKPCFAKPCFAKHCEYMLHTVSEYDQRNQFCPKRITAGEPKAARALAYLALCSGST
jgi:hypothetical protein